MNGTWRARQAPSDDIVVHVIELSSSSDEFEVARGDEQIPLPAGFRRSRRRHDSTSSQEDADDEQSLSYSPTDRPDDGPILPPDGECAAEAYQPEATDEHNGPPYMGGHLLGDPSISTLLASSGQIRPTTTVAGGYGPPSVPPASVCAGGNMQPEATPYMGREPIGEPPTLLISSPPTRSGLIAPTLSYPTPSTSRGTFRRTICRDSTAFIPQTRDGAWDRIPSSNAELVRFWGGEILPPPFISDPTPNRVPVIRGSPPGSSRPRHLYGRGATEIRPLYRYSRGAPWQRRDINQEEKNPNGPH